MTGTAPRPADFDPEPQRRAFGARLRALRESHGETQSSVAESVNASRPFYSQVERGENNVSLEYVFRLAHHFGVPVHELFTDLDAYEPSQGRT